jgi:hypothetical protein
MTLHAFDLTRWFKIIHVTDNFSGVMAHNLVMPESSSITSEIFFFICFFTSLKSTMKYTIERITFVEYNFINSFTYFCRVVPFGLENYLELCLSILVGTISNVLVMEISWTDVGSGGVYLSELCSQ